MKLASQKEWIVRTQSREILGPYTYSELLEHLKKETFTLNDELCNTDGNWLAASVLSTRDVEEVTRTSTRANTSSIELTKSDLTPTPTSTDKITPPDAPLAKSNVIPLKRPLNHESPNFNQKIQDSNFSTNSQNAQKKATSNSTAKYPLLTAIVLTILTLVLFNRPEKSSRETSEASPSKSTHREKDESPLVKNAMSLVKLGKNKQALKLLANYHESHSKTDTSYLPLYAGLLITEGESVLRAKRILEQVLTSQASATTKSEAHLWLGYLLLSEDDSDIGESHFLEALQLDPKDPIARFNLGRTYLKQGKYQQALDYLQLAELELPNLWLIQVHKGWAKFSIGSTQDSAQAFRSAINFSKDRWVSYIYQAIFQTKAKDFEGSRETMLKMLGRDPDYERLSPIPLGFYQSKTNYEEYLNAYALAMEKATDDEKQMGKIYLTYLSNPISRTEDWRKMDVLANRSDSIFPRILSLKMMLPHGVNAVYLKTILTKLPPNLDYFGPYAYVLRGKAREELNQVSEALLDYQKALALDPECAVALWHQYDLFTKLRRSPEARDALKTLVTLHPNYIPALAQLPNF